MNAKALKVLNEKELYLLLSDTTPELRKKENLQNWEVLFDGTNTNKWRGKDSDTFPLHGWIIEKGSGGKL